ncbi:MAG: HAMP domain-containing histidine kinase [Candidatus Tectomicrobia bacterium]|uniref:histidine kinase n=1 Tax=Tectimicrobiota bacterium TaxID=2528274 RepID=A0A932CRT2_UNCTE|nr:HAMP domain-containing histidine kinase [Candidatus Tectomicrobia bacterium]
MRIRVRLLLGYLGLALLVGVAGYVVASVTKMVHGEFDAVAEETIPVVLALEELRFAGLKIVSFTHEFGPINSGSPAADKEVRQDGLRRVALSGMGPYEDAFQRYEALLNRFFPDEKELLEGIRSTGQGLQRTSAAILERKAQGAWGPEILGLQERLKEEEKAFMQAIDTALAHETGELSERKESLESTIATAVNTSMVLNLFTVSVAILGGLLISRSISIPIIRLKDAALEIGKGKLDTRIALRARKDEVGVLADAFNQMAGEIQGLVGSLEQANRMLQENHERLLVTEKMASLGRLTAGIAHEMSTPLAAVRAALAELSQLANEYRTSIDDPEVTPDDHGEIAREMQQSIQLADHAAGRAAAFVRSIKFQTRDLATQERQRFNAVTAIQEALLLLGYALRKGGCTAVFEPAVDYVELYGSPGRLAQVMTNLVTNAIEASVANGGGPITVHLTPKSEGVELQVSDQGGGIPPEHFTKIFEPMFTTKPFGQGTGLGLAIVHEIITGDFGGTIEVASLPDQGTTFTLHFPHP